MNKEIEIILEPKDFEDTIYNSIGNCPLARAANRTLKVTDACCGSSELYINKFLTTFKIVKRFTHADFEFVRKAYAKDPKMKKARYVVTLTPN